jgi:anaerobic magnesium-protoporphyrin IX monomethyl ester cyclase
MIQAKTKVLLIYPTLFKITGLPLGLASLSSVLRDGGHIVKVFDTACFDINERLDENEIRIKRMMAKRATDEDKYLFKSDSNVKTVLTKLINEYKPQLVGISILEPNYETSLLLSKIIKGVNKEIIIVAGGVFPTLAPDVVIKEECIDAVCLGEGENALLELCNRISTNDSVSDIDGLWIKNEKETHKNKLGQLKELNELPHPDFDCFDERMFYKPMQGKLYKMVNIEISRGCPYKCSYCAAPELKNLYKNSDSSKYYRLMRMEKIFDQIHYQIKRHSPEFIYFSSETFLAMKKSDFEMFIEEYKKIKLPFWFQTRFETIREDWIRKLKDVGMFWLTIGLEHGNEEFRKKRLKRHYSNEVVLESMMVLKKLDCGATINNMIGFPFETRELIFDTIKLNKKLWQLNNKLETNAYIFTPFRGCELYDLCKKNGLLNNDTYIKNTEMYDETVLNFSDEFKADIKSLVRTFNLYVRLPEEYFPRIKVAELDNEEGDLMFSELTTEALG